MVNVSVDMLRILAMHVTGAVLTPCRLKSKVMASFVFISMVLVFFPLMDVLFTLFLEVNECLDNNGGCNQTCINTAGSFQCNCSTGYVLAPDGRGCNGIYTTVKDQSKHSIHCEFNIE